MLFKKLMAGNVKGCVDKIFAEKVARGNSVQIRPDFPAKSLSIYTKFFLSKFLLKMTYQRELKQIKCEMKLEMFIECLLQDNSFTDFSLVNK